MNTHFFICYFTICMNTSLVLTYFTFTVKQNLKSYFWMFISLISWYILPLLLFLKNLWNSELFWKVCPLSSIVFSLGKCIFQRFRRAQFHNFSHTSPPTIGAHRVSLNMLPMVCPKIPWVWHWYILHINKWKNTHLELRVSVNQSLAKWVYKSMTLKKV